MTFFVASGYGVVASGAPAFSAPGAESALCDAAPRGRDIRSQIVSKCYVLQERRACCELNFFPARHWSAPDLRLF
jgi:hypothetical protein